MLNQLSDSNNRIVDNITQLSETSEEVMSSSMQASELSVQNLRNAETTKEMLHQVLDVSHELEQYLQYNVSGLCMYCKDLYDL